MFTVRHEVMLNILAIEADFSVSWPQQPDQHFYGCAFTRAVRAEISENTSENYLETHVLNGGNRTVEFCELQGFQHATPGHTPISAGATDYLDPARGGMCPGLMEKEPV